MGYSGLALLIFSLTGSFLLGLRIRGNRALASIVAVVCTLMLVIRAIFRHFPDIEFALLPFGWYSAIHAWWAVPFAFLLFGIGIVQLRSKRERWGLGFLAAALFFATVSHGWATVRLDPDEQNGVPDARCVVFQTTKFSCGAAAAATVLTRIGYPTTEREMAIRCGTNAVTGTDEIAAALCLREKLGATEKQVQVNRAEWDDLRRMPMPVMATNRMSALLDHWVVILKVEPERVTVADPTIGIHPLTRDRFLKQWLGVLVRVH